MNINPQKIIDRRILIPSSYTQIQQVGIDVSTAVDIELRHTGFTNFSCNEVVRLPSDVFALVISRSTFNRAGIIIRGCVFDPGYRGRIHLSAYNLSGKQVFIEKNTRVAQIVFFKAKPHSVYSGIYQNEGLK